MNNFKMPPRNKISNKGSYGKVLNFVGCDNYIGAAYLSTVSPYKVGAGFVALASERKVIDSVAKMLPEAVYLSRKEGLSSIENYTVCILGCGLGLEKKSIEIFNKVLKRLHSLDIPLVLDADGLNILANTNVVLPQNTIITPHPMEAARLLNCSLEEVLSDMQLAASRLYQKYSCVVVLKSHATIVLFKDEYFINDRGNSALAKAGSGDVLAGIIAGLLAQKMTPYEAAKLGVYLHSRAGEIASEDLTQYSVLASDLIKYIPKAIAEIS